MPEMIINASGPQYGLVINPDGSLNTAISGGIHIGSVSANVDSIYVQSGDNININKAEVYGSGTFVGSIINLYSGSKSWIIDTVPIDSDRNNESWKFEYESNNNLGSITQFIGGGSYVSVFTWQGYSGTTIGVGSRITNMGAWV